VDVEGQLNVCALQLLAGGADALEYLAVNNTPGPASAAASAAGSPAAAAADLRLQMQHLRLDDSGSSLLSVSDEWLEALVHVNKYVIVVTLI